MLLGWTCLNATWTMRDACTVTDSSAQSGASQVLCERSVTSTISDSHLRCACPRSGIFLLLTSSSTSSQILGTSQTHTYVKEHSIVNPDEKKMELCSTNVSSQDTREEESTIFSLLLRPNTHPTTSEKKKLYNTS